MLPPPLFIPPDFGIELIYTVTIMVLCFLVYYKTKEVYELTKHKGVQFFRYSFIFFGLAYASRLFLYVIMVGDVLLFEPFVHPHRMSLMPASNLVLAYFSTMAIFYLVYSTIWKKYSTEHFLTISNIVALFIAVIAFISRSPLIVSLTQLILLLIVIIVNIKNHHNGKSKKRKPMYALYYLIATFWLVSLFAISVPKMFLPFGVKWALQIISLAVFATLYYKIVKWVK